MNSDYRTDPRDANEVNFARFDTKLEQRLAEQAATMERRLAALESKTDLGLLEIQREIKQLEVNLMLWMLVLSVTQLLFLATFTWVALRPR